MFDLDAAVRGRLRELDARSALPAGVLAELEDHIRAEYEAQRRGGLPPSEAFERACGTLGDTAALAAEFKKVEPVTWKRLVVAGWVLFAVAFLAPVHRWDFTPFDLHIARGTVPGIQAFLTALTGEAGLIGILSALTNVGMLATVWPVSGRARGPAIPLTIALGVAFILNGWWLVAVDRVDDLMLGYYLWWASFGIVAVGLAVRTASLMHVGLRQRSAA